MARAWGMLGASRSRTHLVELALAYAGASIRRRKLSVSRWCAIALSLFGQALIETCHSRLPILFENFEFLRRLEFSGATGQSGPSTVDRQNLTRDPPAAFIGEEQGCVRDVLGSAKAFRVNRLQELLLVFGSIIFPLTNRRRVGEDQSGGDGIDGDAMRSELPGQLLGQANQRVFGGSVSLDSGQARPQPGAGGNVHDAAVASLFHDRRDRLGQPERAVHIGFEYASPILLGNILDRPAGLPPDASGGIDQYVDTPMALGDDIHGVPGLASVGKI